jgi:hypothetical protein
MKDCLDCLAEGETCAVCLLAEECPGCGEMFDTPFEDLCPKCLAAHCLTLAFVPPDPPRERKEGDCVRCYDEPAKYDYPVADRTIRVGGKCWYALTGRAYREPEFQEVIRGD